MQAEPVSPQAGSPLPALVKDQGVLRGAWSRRGMIIALTYRSFQIRYRQSMIGFLWAFIPLVGMLLASTVVFDKIAKINTHGIPYPLFVICGLLPWGFFSSAVGSAVSSIAGNNMVANVAFPRAVLPFYQVGTSLMDLGVSIIVFIGYVAISPEAFHRLSLQAFWAFPLLLLELVLIAGLVLLGSALNTFARDVRIILGSIMPLWLLLTPVLYPLETVPEQYRWAFSLNPMTGIAVSFRRTLAEGKGPDFALLLPTLVISLVLLVWGTWYFGATQKRFSDVV